MTSGRRSLRGHPEGRHDAGQGLSGRPDDSLDLLGVEPDRQITEDLDQRCGRELLIAELDTMSDEHLHLLTVGQLGQRLDQARFPHAGLPADHEDSPRTVGFQGPDQPAHQGQLVPSTH